MSELPTPSLSLPSPGPDRLTTSDRTPTPAAEKAKLGELAAQFESMLMLEMIKQMRKSLLDEEGEGDGLGKETYSSTIDGELALHLAKAGGIGLTPMMVDAWERQQMAVAPGSLVTPLEGRAMPVGPSAGLPTAAAAVAPVAVSAIRQGLPELDRAAAAADSTLSLEMTGRVSSAYGWRTDPLKGQTKFHGGIDLAARYGTQVPAAAGGTVVTADEQGGYGLTVVIRHPNGFESRYAHLSSLDVKAGEAVAQGQQVGRVGSTGRSTGPHLHFEVTQAGRRVDPEQFVRNLTSDTKGQ
jgi:murein DD-endopeptidase MepM/ murein hydrolase activator NlpD